LGEIEPSPRTQSRTRRPLQFAKHPSDSGLVSTSGQLSGGRRHGFGFVAEACRHLRGERGERQVNNCEVAVVGVGAGPVAGGMLLTR